MLHFFVAKHLKKEGKHFSLALGEAHAFAFGTTNLCLQIFDLLEGAGCFATKICKKDSSLAKPKNHIKMTVPLLKLILFSKVAFVFFLQISDLLGRLCEAKE